MIFKFKDLYTISWLEGWNKNKSLSILIFIFPNFSNFDELRKKVFDRKYVDSKLTIDIKVITKVVITKKLSGRKCRGNENWVWHRLKIIIPIRRSKLSKFPVSQRYKFWYFLYILLFFIYGTSKLLLRIWFFFRKNVFEPYERVRRVTKISAFS